MNGWLLQSGPLYPVLFCFFELHIPLRMDCLKIAVPKQKTLSPSKLPDTVGSKCLIFRQLHYHMFSVNPNVTIVLLNIATFAASQQNSPCFNKQGLVWLWYHILMSHVSDLLLDSEKMRDSLTLSIIYPIENISYPVFPCFSPFFGMPFPLLTLFTLFPKRLKMFSSLWELIFTAQHAEGTRAPRDLRKTWMTWGFLKQRKLGSDGKIHYKWRMIR